VQTRYYRLHPGSMGDLESQLETGAQELAVKQSCPQSEDSRTSTNLDHRSPRAARESVLNDNNSSPRTSSGPTRDGPHRLESPLVIVDEDRELFVLARNLLQEPSAPQAWLLEMSHLRRLHFLHINKRLAACKRKIMELGKVTDEGAENLKSLFHEQGNSYATSDSRAKAH
jgi:hypothetical protein